MRLDYAILLAEGLGAMRHFYVDVLGLKVRSEHPDWIELFAERQAPAQSVAAGAPGTST